jgi:hypothetical protein
MKETILLSETLPLSEEKEHEAPLSGQKALWGHDSNRVFSQHEARILTNTQGRLVCVLEFWLY